MSGRALPPRVRRSDLVLADLLNDPTVLGVLGGPPADAAAIVARVLADPTVMRDSRRLLTEPKAARDLLISAVDEVVDVLADGAGPAAVHHLLVEPDRHVATAAGFVLLSSFATSGGVPIVVSLTATVTRGPDGNPAVAGVALDDYVGRDVHQRLVDDVTALAAATGFVPERPCARVALIIGRGFGAQRHEVIATAAVEGVAIEVFANVDPDNPDSLEAVRRRVAGACSGVVTWTGKSDQWAMRLATDAERQGKLRFAIYGDDQVALQMRSVARKLLVAGEARQAAPVAPPSRKLTLCLKRRAAAVPVMCWSRRSLATTTLSRSRGEAPKRSGRVPRRSAICPLARCCDGWSYAGGQTATSPGRRTAYRRPRETQAELGNLYLGPRRTVPADPKRPLSPEFDLQSARCGTLWAPAEDDPTVEHRV